MSSERLRDHVSVPSASPYNLESSSSPSPEEESLRRQMQKRGVLPKQATNVMRSWLFQHIVVSQDPVFIFMCS